MTHASTAASLIRHKYSSATDQSSTWTKTLLNDVKHKVKMVRKNLKLRFSMVSVLPQLASTGDIKFISLQLLPADASSRWKSMESIGLNGPHWVIWYFAQWETM